MVQRHTRLELVSRIIWSEKDGKYDDGSSAILSFSSSSSISSPPPPSSVLSEARKVHEDDGVFNEYLGDCVSKFACSESILGDDIAVCL